MDRVAAGLVVCAAIGCRTSEKTASSVTGPADVNAADVWHPAEESTSPIDPAPARNAAPWSPKLCPTTTGFRVVTRNTSARRTDLCVAVNRALSKLPTTLGPGRFELLVTLTNLTISPNVRCTLSVTVRSASGFGAFERGGAEVTGAGSMVTLAARDCIEATVESMMTRHLAPAMQQHVINLAAGTATIGGASQPNPGSGSASP